MIGSGSNDNPAGGAIALPAALPIALPEIRAGQRRRAAAMALLALTLCACGSGYGADEAERAGVGEERALRDAAEMLESRTLESRTMAPDTAEAAPEPSEQPRNTAR